MKAKLLWLLAFLPAFALAQAAPTSVTDGRTVTLTATASGTAPLSWQWFYLPDGAQPTAAQPLPGATSNVLVLSRFGPAHAGNYFVQVSNAAGSAKSDLVALSFAPAVPGKPAIKVEVSQ